MSLWWCPQCECIRTESGPCVKCGAEVSFAVIDHGSGESMTGHFIIESHRHHSRVLWERLTKETTHDG